MTADASDMMALAQTGAVTLSELPWGAHAIAAAGLVLGVALLLVGRKLLRTGVIVGAAIAGGAMAFYAPASFGVNFDPNILMAAGLAAGAIAGLMLYRLTVSLSLMVLMSLAGVLIAGSMMRVSAGSLPAPEPTDAEQTELAAELLSSETAQDAAEHAWERVRAFGGDVAAAAGDEWAALDGREKSVLLGSGLLGAAAGLLLGAVFPKRSAAAMSSFAGAALAIPSAAWLAETMIADSARFLPTSAAAWLSAWAGLSVVGMAVQWTSVRRRADS